MICFLFPTCSDTALALLHVASRLRHWQVCSGHPAATAGCPYRNGEPKQDLLAQRAAHAARLHPRWVRWNRARGRVASIPGGLVQVCMFPADACLREQPALDRMRIIWGGDRGMVMKTGMGDGSGPMGGGVERGRMDGKLRIGSTKGCICTRTWRTRALDSYDRLPAYHCPLLLSAGIIHAVWVILRY